MKYEWSDVHRATRSLEISARRPSVCCSLDSLRKNYFHRRLPSLVQRSSLPLTHACALRPTDPTIHPRMNLSSLWAIYDMTPFSEMSHDFAAMSHISARSLATIAKLLRRNTANYKRPLLSDNVYLTRSVYDGVCLSASLLLYRAYTFASHVAHRLVFVPYEY